MGDNNNRRLRFGDYELDSFSGALLRERQPVKLQPQPLRVLTVLVEQRGEIVSRQHLRERIWGDATFVEFDDGLNYCIRQIRVALGDDASNPRYIETLPKQGYRLIASGAPDVDAVASPKPPATKQLWWRLIAVAGVVAAIGTLTAVIRQRPARIAYQQLTDFTDSAVSPAVSPDGRMIAFIRGNRSFLTADQIYVKVLPNGEPKRLTQDAHLKYGPAFSPDGSQIVYAVIDGRNFSTFAISSLGGDSHILLTNAAGLAWLDPQRVLFSRKLPGRSMGLVSGTLAGEDVRDVYFPAHERAMTHYSYPSPDHKSILVVEMNEVGKFVQCRLVSTGGVSPSKPIGPQGVCRSAGWSPDGSWMYFTADVNGQSHLWRQQFPNGQPEQMTFGPTEEEGVAVESSGSIITSIGAHESTIWIHDAKGERALSSEGEVVTNPASPSFSADDKFLYYLIQRQTAGSPGPELWRAEVASGKAEPVFPGISMLDYDVSPDGKEVVYSTSASEGKRELWLAPIDRSSPARKIGNSGEATPYFGPGGEIVFQMTEENHNYLETMKADGSLRSKVVPYPINTLEGISPGRHWATAVVPLQDGSELAEMVISLDDGQSQRICREYCLPKWSSNGHYIYVAVELPSQANPGRSLAIPLGPREQLPKLPPGGVRLLDEPTVVPGAFSVNRADFVPGGDASRFAYVNTTMHRNLYRVSLP